MRWPTPNARPRAFALSWLAYASYYVGRKGFSVSKVAVATELGLGTPALAVIDTAFLAAYAIGQVPSGLLADRFGPRRLLLFGLLGSALACALFGAASGAFLLALCFALNGLAQSTGWPAATKVMADFTTPADRGRVMGLWSTCYQVGGVLGTALATYLLVHHGWRAAFYVPAIWLAAMAWVVARWLPQRRARGKAPLPSLPASQAGWKKIIFGSRETRPKRAFRSPPAGALARRGRERIPAAVYAYGASYFCVKLIRYSLLFWLPFYLHRSAGMDQEQSGYLATAFELGGVLGSVGLGYASDRLTQRRPLAALISLLLLAGALFAYAQLEVEGVAFHAAALALIGALLFGPDSLISGAVAQDAGGTQRAATTVGIVNGIGSAGALLQGVLTVSVHAAFGWHALFYVFFVLALLAALCLVPSLAKTRSRSE